MSIPLRCPKCRGENVIFAGYDASAEKRGEKKPLYECLTGNCHYKFSESLREHDDRMLKRNY